ncbi:MAG: S8 family peptidase [Candidatus Aminicenantes bacterium]
MEKMRKHRIFFLLFITFVFAFSTSFQNQRLEREKKLRPPLFDQDLKLFNHGLPFRSRGEAYAPHQVLVKFKVSLSAPQIEATIASYQSHKIRRIPRIDIYQLQIPKEFTVEEMLFILRQNPHIEYAEPNPVAYITVIPNDPFFGYQYALHNSGQEIGPPGSPQGKASADIKATSAWEETKGNKEVVIAVIDTGVDLEHPDIKNKVLSSGRDFANDDYEAVDDNGHGTLVAGIAAAETNNHEGTAGVAWNCKILPIKAMDEEGSGFYSWIIEGIIWAADNDADVINLSLGGDVPAQSLEDTLQYAFNKDVVIAAAAGNDAGSVIYPAAYDKYCLAVAATDYNDRRPDWSNFGPEVDVAAPGERVAGPVPTWFWGPGSFPYAYGFGTSVATPHVAGLAALIKSIKPWLKAQDLMKIIRYSAEDVNSSTHSGKDDFIGYGRMNMEKALVPIKITSLE